MSNAPQPLFRTTSFDFGNCCNTFLSFNAFFSDIKTPPWRCAVIHSQKTILKAHSTARQMHRLPSSLAQAGLACVAQAVKTQCQVSNLVAWRNFNCFWVCLSACLSSVLSAPGVSSASKQNNASFD